MNIKIYPSVPEGVFTAPPSKSMAHRLLICAGLSSGVSHISNVAYSEDVLATIDCLKALGAEIETDNDTVTVKGINRASIQASGVLPCRECGSTLRFFIPICLLSEDEITLTGSERLLSRPQSVYENICTDQLLTFRRGAGSITVAGPLSSGDYYISGEISSQFISGMMFALASQGTGSRIHITGKIESRPYINLTISALNKFGVNANWENNSTVLIPAGAGFKATDTSVEGDWSNAAFFEFLSQFGELEITGVDSESLQGDKICCEHLEAIKNGCPEIDLSDCPDLGPVLFAAAACYHGAHFTGTRRLKIKESDRVQSMKTELGKFGTEIIADDNEVYVKATCFNKPEEILCSHNDHRIAMALSILLTRTGGEISDAGCVAKSMPDFYDRLADLGVKTETYET